MGQNRYRLLDDEGPAVQAPPQTPSFLDHMREGLDTRTLDESPTVARLKGFASGALEGVQNLAHYAPAATRATTGVLGAEGLGTGALISGAGEAAAELMEGQIPDWKRVGASAAVGAIPFGKVLKEGQVLQSLGRGAAYSAGGGALKRAAAGEPFDGWETAKEGVVGGATIAGLAKVLGVLGKGKVPIPKADPFIVEPTIRTGEGTSVLEGGTINRKGVLTGAKRMPSTRPGPIMGEGQVPVIQGGSTYPENRMPITGADFESGGVPSTVGGPAARSRDRSLSTLDKFFKTRMGARDTEFVVEQGQARANKLRQEAADAGFVEGDRSFGTSESAVDADGVRVSKQQPLVDPNAGGETGGGGSSRNPGYAPKNPLDALMESLGMKTNVGSSELPISPHPDAPWNGARLPIEPPKVGPDGWVEPRGAVEPVMETPPRTPDVAPGATRSTQPDSPLAQNTNVAPRAVSGGRAALAQALQDRGAIGYQRGVEASPSDEQGALARLFKTRQGATGANYRAAKEAAAAGDIPSAAYARDSHLISLGKTPEGPLTTGAPIGDVHVHQVPEVHGGMTEPPAVNPDAGASLADDVPEWIKEQSKLVDAQRDPTQRGAIRPELLHLLAGGTTGAVIGAPIGASQDTDNPTRGALLGGLAGGTIGALAPTAIDAFTRMGVHPSATTAAANTPMSWDGLKMATKHIYEQLPQIQRFNYLVDSEGLPANAVVGPYGSAIMGAIEHALRGDPRGLSAIRELDPRAFARDYKASFVEAGQRVGRAEGEPLTGATTFAQKVTRIPGVFMTAGDLAAGKALQRAGFSEDEARRITLTSEPELPSAKRLADIGKGTSGGKATLLNLLFPFKRTPANILEQGAMRTPGLGAIVQSFRETPDSLKTQLVQQALGLGSGVVGEQLGENLDPETARIAKRYGSNFAGQYGLPFSLGFGMGQAKRADRPMISGLTNEAAFSVPLPSERPIREWLQFLTGQGNIPGGLLPKDIRQLITPNDGPPAAGTQRYKLLE